MTAIANPLPRHEIAGSSTSLPVPAPLPPMEDNPLVSVLMPNYNYGAYIRAAIQSVVEQTYSNWELIVCDDGSSDQSRSIIQEYARQDSRIRYIFQQNFGVAAALNAAYRMSRGQVVALLDADDVFHCSKFARVTAAFREQPRAGFCAHPLRPISANGKPIGSPFPKRLDSGWVGPHLLRNGGDCRSSLASGLLFRRHIADQLFPLPSTLKRMLDGYMTRAALCLTDAVAMSETLADYRFHNANLTGVRKRTPETERRNLEDSWAMLGAVKSFLDLTISPQVSAMLRKEDSRFFVQRCLRLHFFLGGVKDDLPSVDELVRALPTVCDRLRWRILLTLPRYLRCLVYKYLPHPDWRWRFARLLLLPRWKMYRTWSTGDSRGLGK